METCLLAFGIGSLELGAVRAVGVDKEGELRVLDHSSKTWHDRIVVLRKSFLLIFQLDGGGDGHPKNVLRIDPDTDVMDGFGDSGAHYTVICANALRTPVTLTRQESWCCVAMCSGAAR
jgi:hypothetical protein